MQFYQTTINKSCQIEGLGLHSGCPVHVTISPAPINTGIVFQRTDLVDAEPIQAHPRNISSTDLCTIIGKGDNRVATIEHLMAALVGLGIDNAIVEVDAEEIPILDGSASPFAKALLNVGQCPQAAKRKLFYVKEAFEVRIGDQFMRIEPAIEGLSFECSIDFPDSKIIGRQSLKYKFSRESFLELCRARTFCLLRHVEEMQARGLAKGGSLDNAIVVDDEKVLNLEGLRYKDEFIRHKLLDCIGDLGLLGGQLIGRITTHKAGHSLHAKFTKALIERLHVVSDSPSTSRTNGAEGLGRVAQARRHS